MLLYNWLKKHAIGREAFEQLYQILKHPLFKAEEISCWRYDIHVLSPFLFSARDSLIRVVNTPVIAIQNSSKLDQVFTSHAHSHGHLRRS